MRGTLAWQAIFCLLRIQSEIFPGAFLEYVPALRNRETAISPSPPASWWPPALCRVINLTTNCIFPPNSKEEGENDLHLSKRNTEACGWRDTLKLVIATVTATTISRYKVPMWFFTCGEAISDMRRRSTSRFSSSPSPSSNRQILAILIKLLLLIDTRRLGNSRDMRFPGKCDFPGNRTSRKLQLPRKYDFRGNLTTWEVWNYYFAGKCGFLGNLTSREMWIPGKYDCRKCEFL